MQDKPLESGEEKIELPKEPSDQDQAQDQDHDHDRDHDHNHDHDHIHERHSTAAAVGEGDEQSNSLEQPVQDGQLHPSPSPALAGPLVVPGPLDVDTQEDYSDSNSGFDARSQYTSTASLRTSIYQYIEENGRTYHKFKAGKYLLPNDEVEQDRLDLQHHLFLLTLDGRLHLAPIENLPGGIHNVLDVATGTGIWAIEFATQFPAASVIGTDLSPIQPAFVPPNCRFEVDDAEDPWLYSHQFDYIHMRAVSSCFRSHLDVIKSAFAHVRPGGYLELQDGFLPVQCPDGTLAGSAVEEWDRKLAEGAHALGKDWHRTSKYKAYMEEVGFVDVVETKFAWPAGPWAKDPKLKLLGLWGRENFMSLLQGLSLAVMTRGLGMSAQEVEVLLARVRADINLRRVHFYAPVTFVYGRKPESAE